MIKNYCSLPYRGMQIDNSGEIKPCCLYKSEKVEFYKPTMFQDFDQWWKVSLDSLRQTVRDDKIDTGCQTCFGDGFVHPLRERANDSYKSYQVRSTPDWLDVRFGNMCNLKCMMCTPHASSQITLEWQANRDKFAMNKFYDIDFVPNSYWWKDPDQVEKIKKILSRATVVNFSGGEPLMVPILHEILDVMPATCFISFNTNLTKLSDEFFRSIAKFRKVNVVISMDGIQQHQEYIRYGSDWKTLDHNIKWAKDVLGTNFTASYLLQHTTVYTWTSVWNYLNNLDIRVEVFPVYANTIDNSGLIGADSVSPQDWQKFLDQLDTMLTPHTGHINEWVAQRQYSYNSHKRFQAYVGTLDDLRSTNFRQVFDPTWL